MENETFLPEEHDEHMGEVIVVTDDDGEEHQLHVLASKEGENCMYLLAAVAVDDDEDSSEVLHLKCANFDASKEPDDEELSLELVEEDHEDFQLVMELFKADYEELGILVDEEDPLFGA